MEVDSLFGNLPALVGNATNATLDENIALYSATLPRQSSARIPNSAGTFISPVPATNLTFPYNASDLPDSFSALSWANLPAVNSSGTSKPFINLFVDMCYIVQSHVRRALYVVVVLCAGLPEIYPLGNLIYLVADQNIGATGAQQWCFSCK